MQLPDGGFCLGEKGSVLMEMKNSRGQGWNAAVSRSVGRREYRADVPQVLRKKWVILSEKYSPITYLFTMHVFSHISTSSLYKFNLSMP